MKKLLIFLLSFFLININVMALDFQTYERTKEVPRVNKDIEINDSNIYNILVTPSVNSNDKIYDFANVLNEKQKTYIDNFVKKYKMDMAVVTIDNHEQENTRIFAEDFYDYNDFGIDIKNNSGILLVLDFDTAKNNGSRRVEILTTGKAMLMYDDARINYIHDMMTSNLQIGNYDGAINIFINEATSYAKAGMPKSADSYYIDEFGDIQTRFNPNETLLFVISSILTFIYMMILVSKNKMVQLKHSAENYLQNESKIDEQDHFKTTFTTKIPLPKSSSSSGGGSNFSRGSSGTSHGGSGRNF